MSLPLPETRPEPAEQPVPPLPLFRVALWSILGFWTVYFVLATAVIFGPGICTVGPPNVG